MILELENWSLGYSQILTDCRSTISQHDGVRGTSIPRLLVNRSVLILCNYDVDAIAAARILTYMLRNDGITYQLLPCTSYDHLRHILMHQRRQQQHRHQKHRFDDEDQPDDDVDETSTFVNEPAAVVLLNMGANRNLTRLFAEQIIPKQNSGTHGTVGGGVEVDQDPTIHSPLLSPSVKVYVLDCRRPVHLANVHAGENIVVFWDQNASEDIPSDGDNLSGQSSSDEDDDDSSRTDDAESRNDDDASSDEGDFEFEMEGEKDLRKDQQSAASLTFDVESGDEYDADHEDGETTSKSKRRRTSPRLDTENAQLNEALGVGSKDKSVDPKQLDDGIPTDTTLASGDSEIDEASTMPLPTFTPRELHQHRSQRLRLYYSQGTFYGSPAAYKAYRVATQLRFGDVGDLLWLACVGVTDAYLHSRLDVTGYTTLAMDLRSYSLRLYPTDAYHRLSHAVYAEQLTSNPISRINEVTQIRFSEKGRILSESDFRFFLLRHTSLLDAMMYSDFMSTKFQLITRAGVHKLQEMLAKMGFPLDECRQPFAFMKPSLRRKLPDRFRQHAEEYGLEHFEFTSFFRITGYQSLLSACDTSYAASALLECEHGASFTGRNASEAATRMESFNAAFDAINSNAAGSSVLDVSSGSSLSSLINGDMLGTTSLGAGLQLAMSLQKCIVATAANLISRNVITRLSHFRYSYITVTSRAENAGLNGIRIDAMTDNANDLAIHERNHIFSKPLALTRLAHYLMDLHRENGKWTGPKARPLILLAENPRLQTFLVVGYEYPEYAGHFVRNRFGRTFELASQSLNLKLKSESFDSHVVEVDARDVQRFLEQLHYLLDEA
jgi:cell division control protein 45